MQYYTGRVLEIRLEIYKFPSYLVECPAEALARPGQYIQAHATQNSDAALATTLFPVSLPETKGGFSSLEMLSSEPVDWLPGTTLQLRGPLGKGFSLPQDANRVSLIALDNHPARLLPLLAQALAQNAAVALFCDTPPAGLPSAIEVNPLSAYQDAMQWADTTTFDIPIQKLKTLRQQLNIPFDLPLPSDAQALIHSPMPCSALAECGICSIKVQRAEVLTCKDGPVLKLKHLLL